MDDRRGKFDMTHSLSAYAVVCDLHSAAVTYHPSELGAASLIFSAGALITAGRTKYPFAEKSVFFRTERPVIYCFRLFDFTA